MMKNSAFCCRKKNDQTKIPAPDRCRDFVAAVKLGRLFVTIHINEGKSRMHQRGNFVCV